jgi:hypothetical protein
MLFAIAPLAQRLEYGAELLTFRKVWFDIPQAFRHPKASVVIAQQLTKKIANEPALPKTAKHAM